MGFHAGAQEILAGPNHYRAAAVGRADRFCPGQRRGTVYLHALLGRGVHSHRGLPAREILAVRGVCRPG